MCKSYNGQFVLHPLHEQDCGKGSDTYCIHLRELGNNYQNIADLSKVIYHLPTPIKLGFY